jgi:hypothetical protein
METGSLMTIKSALMSKKWGWHSIKKWAKKKARKVVNHVKKAAHNVAKGIKKAASSVGNLAKKVVKKVMSMISKVVKPVITKIKKFVHGFINKLSMMKKFIDAMICIKNKGKAVIATAKKNILGFIKAIKTMFQGWTGFVKVIINTVCNWHVFKRCITDFINSLKNHGLKRWKLMGNFVGGLVASIGGGM